MTMRILTILAVTGAVLLSACNTVAGMGRDVQSAGNAVSKAAKPAK
jgi:predicted small secreted protein